MDIPKIRTAVIGCGAISDIYLSNLKDRFEIIDLVACSDRNAWKRDQKAEMYGIRSMDIGELIASPDIDMIVNLTSPAGHYEITKRALEHGKHVFTEKMLAIDPDEGRDLLETAERCGVRLGSAPDTFLGGGIQTAKYILEHGLIGAPVSAVISLNKDFRVYGDVLRHLNGKGGNLLFDCGCYYLTALAALLGPVREVTAFGDIHGQERTSVRIDRRWFGETIKTESYNIVSAALKYDCGLIASMHVDSATSAEKGSELTIYGTEGMLEIGDPNEFGHPVFLSKNRNGRCCFPFTHGYTENSRGLGAAEMAWSIARGREHRASKEMAFHVFEVLHGIETSVRTGRIYEVESRFRIPDALPEGFISSDGVSPLEESALV